MKQTLNINLAGYPFTIDEDAYQLLKDYLDTIRYAFKTKDDTEDLATDIESRIAELLLENESGKVRIVTLAEVTQVIERIGKPSDFIEVDETVESNADAETSSQEVKIEEQILPPPYEQQKYSRNPFVRKRLFRDPQNSLLGGVCSGLASYLNIDVTIVRLLAVVLFFISASTVAIIYIILWIVVPPATTPLQLMQMKGEDPTMANIGKTVTEKFQNNDAQTNANISGNGNGIINNIFSIFVKCLIILGMIIAVPLLIVLGATLIGCMIAVFVIGIGIFSGGMFDSFNEGLMVLFIILAVIGGAITLGIPLWLLIRRLWKKNDSNVSATTQRSMLIIWLLGIVMVAVFTTKAVRTGKKLDHEHWGFNKENIQALEELDEEELDQLKIERGRLYITTKDGKKVEIFNGNVFISTADSESQEVVADSIATVEVTDSITTVEITDSVAGVTAKNIIQP